jgi:hypothetical protein
MDEERIRKDAIQKADADRVARVLVDEAGLALGLAIPLAPAVQARGACLRREPGFPAVVGLGIGVVDRVPESPGLGPVGHVGVGRK